MPDKSPFEPEDPYYRRSYEEDMQIFREAVSALALEFDVKKINRSEEADIYRKLSSFHSLQEIDEVVLRGALKIGKGYLLLLSVNYQIQHVKPKYHQRLTELEFAGLGNLTVDLSKTFIRRETLSDKINEIFVPIEVDFDFDREFSKKYYVLTDNQENLRQKMPPQLLEIIKDQPDVEIEINGRKLLIRNCQRITVDGAFNLAKFLLELHHI